MFRYTGAQVHFTGKNIGDLLNVRGVTWGWFEGGFDLSLKNPNGTTGCARSTRSRVTKVRITDYLPIMSHFSTTLPPAT